MEQQQRKEMPMYRVDWVGQDPNMLFTKVFKDGKEALSLANKNEESIAYKFVKNKDNTMLFKILPTKGSKEMVRAIKLKRQMREKSGFSNFINDDGIGEVAEVTTTEFKMNQKARVISIVAISGALIYAGTRKEALQPWLRYTLMGLGGAYALFTFRNYKKNQNV